MSKNKPRAKKREPRNPSETPYQRMVRKLLAGPVGLEIQREFKGAKEVVYALRVASGYLASSSVCTTGRSRGPSPSTTVSTATGVRRRQP
jgi:hypothetical protein